jgi:hypothetical protein
MLTRRMHAFQREKEVLRENIIATANEAQLGGVIMDHQRQAIDANSQRGSEVREKRRRGVGKNEKKEREESEERVSFVELDVGSWSRRDI